MAVVVVVWSCTRSRWFSFSLTFCQSPGVNDGAVFHLPSGSDLGNGGRNSSSSSSSLPPSQLSVCLLFPCQLCEIGQLTSDWPSPSPSPSPSALLPPPPPVLFSLFPSVLVLVVFVVFVVFVVSFCPVLRLILSHPATPQQHQQQQ